MTIDTETAAAAALDLLRRCRRRLSFVAAVRYAGTIVPIAIVAISTIALVAQPTPAFLAVLIAATIGMALVAALVAAMMNAPSLRDAAAALDGRLRLQDRMVTALQVSNDDDPMARLVLRDAAWRVADVSLSQTFPLEPPAHFRALVAAAVSIVVVLAMASAGTSPAWRIDRYRAGAGSAVTGGAQRGRGTPPVEKQTAASVSPAAAAVRPDSAAPVAARGTEPAVGRDIGRTPAGLRAAGSRGGSDGASAPAGRDAAGVAAAAGAPAGGRGAVGEGQGAEPAAGGVKGESLRDAAAADETRPDSPRSPAYAARYRTASARAQAAIAQERVPAGLATYVKNYFIAIRP